MKILLTIHHELDKNAGASGVTLKLGEAYRKLGHEVHFYSYDNLPRRLPGKSLQILFPFYLARHIQRLDRRIGIDVVHASSVDAWLWGLIFKRSRSTQNKILVTQSHGLEQTVHEQILAEAKQGRLKLSWKYPLYKGSILLWKSAFSFQVADFAFLLNQYDANIARHKMKIPASRVKLFPNGIPDDFIGLPFAKFSEPTGTLPEIACLGSYIDRKGIQYSVPVLNRLMQKYPTLRVRFLGTGCAIEKVLADFSEAVRDRITVVPAFPKHDLPKLLRGAQVLVFPSLSEGFPLAVPEAMACGLAPIVTDIPGPTEIIVNDVNGLVVPPRDCERLEGAIELLLNDPDYLNTLRRLAYQTVQGYSWSKIAAQHLELYTSALERQKVGKPEKTVVMQG